MRPKIIFLSLLLLSLSAWGEGRVIQLQGSAQYKKLNEKTRLFNLRNGSKTQSSTFFRVAPFSSLILELSDFTRITASSNTLFYIIEEHEHFTILLKEGTIKVKSLQRLKNQNTRKIVVKTHRARVEASLAEFIVAHMGVMEHTNVYGLSGLTLFHSKASFNKEKPLEIYKNEESELTPLLERPVSTSEFSAKKRKDLEAFFIPKKKPAKS